MIDWWWALLITTPLIIGLGNIILRTSGFYDWLYKDRKQKHITEYRDSDVK
jgi:hypothetical protein